MSGSSSQESWSHLASLIDAVLDAEPADRAALVAELSGGDASRRAELERLVAQCEQEPSLLSRPAAERFAGLLEDGASRFPDALAGRYKVERELARGGMATVFLARDLKLLRDVAVKVLHPAVALALGRERFVREIELVARLRHPHIVPLFDSGDASGSLYYVMPHEPGASLRRRLKEGGPPSMDDALLILRDVCDALAYAHENGIVHCDIKPDNVLLSGRHALVTDFGVARAARVAAEETAPRELRAAGVVLGTPAYMAPEQLAGDPGVDHRADIYSFGVLAYELLGGRLPFTSDASAGDGAMQRPEPPALATLRSEISDSLAQAVMSCLAPRPEDRPGSAADLTRRLDRFAMSSGAATPSAARIKTWLAAAVVLVVLGSLALVAWRGSAGATASWRNRWASARFERLTDFAGSEVDAAISSDGKSVAFLADRDGLFDAYVTRVGSGQFTNLTRARVAELFNEDVRNVGLTARASDAWVRVANISAPASVSLTPVGGGALRPFLPTAVMAVWSPDGARLAYHEATPGDAVYLADSLGRSPRRVFVSAPGIHTHHLSWSPDGRYLYFSHGVPPNQMDVWRMPVSGGSPERITRHDSRVAYPVLLDDRTLLYTATADDGSGPWLYMMDLRERVAHRVNMAIEHYLSIAASAEVRGQPRRLVATVSNPRVHLWSVPVSDSVASEGAATEVALPTARSAAPRFAPDSTLLYLASRGDADGLWHLAHGGASELWKPTTGSVVGAAAVSPDGRRVCFPVHRDGRSTLHCTNADGTGARAVAPTLDVQGAGSWSPDGRWIAIGAMEREGVRLFKIPIDGGDPVRLVSTVSANPVWSPDGRYILYSGVARGRSVPVAAVTPDGNPYALPALTVDRVGDSYRFVPGGKSLVVKLGGFRRQDFWTMDMATGKRRQLTRLRPGESIQRFDVSPDGRRIVFERVRENSDIVLIELPKR